MSEQTLQLTEWMYQQLESDLRLLRERVAKLERGAFNAQTAFSFPHALLADAPTGLIAFENRFITNGRKPGEGAGAGTGVPAFWDPTSAVWISYLSGSAVTV